MKRFYIAIDEINALIITLCFQITNVLNRHETLFEHQLDVVYIRFIKINNLLIRANIL